MSAFFAVVIATALADNIVLTRMLGLCPFIGLSKRLDVATGVGLATTVVLTSACALAWGLDQLLPPALTMLRPLLFITIIACAVQGIEMFLRLTLPLMHRTLGIYLPLIASNCAVLGIMLLTLDTPAKSGWQAVAGGLGGGLGFCLAVIALALLRRRRVEQAVPRALRGAPLAVITAGIMALAFSGLVTPSYSAG